MENRSGLSFAPYEFEKWGYTPVPPPSLNGGLYTGKPFAQGAPYANVPVKPDVDYMIHTHLRTANPPPNAIYQYPGSVRPGNNWQEMPGVGPFSDRHSQLSVVKEQVKKTPRHDLCAYNCDCGGH
jgi:hypothetical protein